MYTVDRLIDWMSKWILISTACIGMFTFFVCQFLFSCWIFYPTTYGLLESVIFLRHKMSRNNSLIEIGDEEKRDGMDEFRCPLCAARFFSSTGVEVHVGVVHDPSKNLESDDIQLISEHRSGPSRNAGQSLVGAVRKPLSEFGISSSRPPSRATHRPTVPPAGELLIALLTHTKYFFPQLVRNSIDWLIYLLDICSLIDCLIDWLVDWLFDWLIDRLVDRLIVDWLIGWLIDWRVFVFSFHFQTEFDVLFWSFQGNRTSRVSWMKLNGNMTRIFVVPTSLREAGQHRHHRRSSRLR